MKRVAFLFLVSLLVSLPALVGAATPRGNVTGGVEHAAPDWFKESFLDIQEDVDEATEAGRHVLLFFQLNNCPYCDRMLREVFESDPLMSYIQAHFDVIAINVLGDREIAFNEELSVTEKVLSERLRVRATPGILFLDADNKPVVRVDGYRSPQRFDHILRFVSSKAYRTQSLGDYLAANLNQPVYTLRDDPLFTVTDDLSAVSGPLAVIFEDSRCHDCAEFHDERLADPAVRGELEAFTVVRLDADSTRPIIDPQGMQTTPRDWAAAMSMSYRPGVLLYAGGELQLRYDSLLFSFHFKEGFRWLGTGAYRSESYGAFSARRMEELLAAGEDVHLGR